MLMQKHSIFFNILHLVFFYMLCFTVGTVFGYSFTSEKEDPDPRVAVVTKAGLGTPSGHRTNAY